MPSTRHKSGRGLEMRKYGIYMFEMWKRSISIKISKPYINLSQKKTRLLRRRCRKKIRGIIDI